MLLSFDGATFDPVLDAPRMTSQFVRVLAVMKDGNWHTLSEIAERISYPPYPKASEAGVSARIRDCRKSRFGGYTIDRRRIGESGLYEYRMCFTQHEQRALDIGQVMK